MPCPRCSSHAVNELCGHCRADLDPPGYAIRGIVYGIAFSVPLWVVLAILAAVLW